MHKITLIYVEKTNKLISKSQEMENEMPYYAFFILAYLFDHDINRIIFLKDTLINHNVSSNIQYPK